MSEPTGSLSFWDIVIEVAERKYRGVQHERDWPTETQLAGTWASHSTAEIAEAQKYINDAKVLTNIAYKKFLRAHDWPFLTVRTTIVGWATATGTAVGLPTYAPPVSTVTTAAAMFHPSMVGQNITFDSSETEYAIAGYTSSKAVTVTGDASGELTGDTLTVNATGYQRLPDAFGGSVIGQAFAYAPDGLGANIVQASLPAIQGARAQNDLAVQYPVNFAIEAVQVGGQQRYNACFWPSFSADTTLHYGYRVQEAELTSAAGTTDYPLGGGKYSSIILDAAMMQVEEDAGNITGPAHSAYKDALKDAILRDAQDRPRNLGYAGDNSDTPPSRQRHIVDYVTYTG